jgi:chromosome segregation ATPase
VNQQYEDYSPSKGIYEYMTNQLKVSELKNDEKDRQLAHLKG